MTNHRTVRLAAFAEASHRAKEGFRIEEQRGNVPWLKDDFSGESKQRRYSGYHALALACREQLTAQGISAAQANERIKLQAFALKKFLEKIAKGENPGQVLIAAIYIGVDDNWSGFHWELQDQAGYGSVDEVVDAFEAQLRRVGTETTNVRAGQTITRRIVCGPMVAVADVGEAYRMAKMKAKAAGYVLDGFDLFPLPAESDEAV